MGNDEPGLTAREERAAAALAAALHEIAAAEPFRVDRAAFAASAPRDRVVRSHLPAGLAAALAVVLIASLAVFAAPRLGIGPSAAQSHFDNGQFAFDYPAGWRVLAADYLEGMANETVAVLGTGVWRSGCYTTDNGGGCTGDIVDVSGGRVVVKIYERVGGPAPDCQAMTTANATLGPNAVSVTSADGATTWEIPLPGKEFGWPGNIFVEAWSDGQAGQSQAEALVASFGWASGAGAGMCVPADTPAPPTVPS